MKIPYDKFQTTVSSVITGNISIKCTLFTTDRERETEREGEERKEGGRGEKGEVIIMGRIETLLIHHSRESVQVPHWHYANSTSGSKSHLTYCNVMIWVID